MLGEGKEPSGQGLSIWLQGAVGQPFKAGQGEGTHHLTERKAEAKDPRGARTEDILLGIFLEQLSAGSSNLNRPLPIILSRFKHRLDEATKMQTKTNTLFEFLLFHLINGRLGRMSHLDNFEPQFSYMYTDNSPSTHFSSLSKIHFLN